MRKTILTVLAATLMAASTIQFAAASEHHHAHKVTHASAADRFRDSNNAIAQPPQPQQPYWPYRGYGLPAAEY
jgi:hypothetical protein